jgi:hypothetical protein
MRGNGGEGYESATDLRNEENFRRIAEIAWNVDIVKQPPSARIDFIAYRYKNRVEYPAAVIEFKQRNRWYDPMHLSAEKFRHGTDLAERLGVPFIMAYCVKHEIRYADITRLDAAINAVGAIGRTDRSDAQDIEPGIRIPLGTMKVLHYSSMP